MRVLLAQISFPRLPVLTVVFLAELLRWHRCLQAFASTRRVNAAGCGFVLARFSRLQNGLHALVGAFVCFVGWARRAVSALGGGRAATAAREIRHRALPTNQRSNRRICPPYTTRACRRARGRRAPGRPRPAGPP